MDLLERGGPICWKPSFVENYLGQPVEEWLMMFNELHRAIEVHACGNSDPQGL